MEDTQKKDISISITRVISVLAIVLTHILKFYDIYDYSILNIFIYVFLVISGYIYSKKEIKNKKAFFINRIKKIMIPFWVWSLISSILKATQGDLKLAIKSFLFSLINFQGVKSVFINVDIFDKSIVSGIQHCWFVTIIMMCYILLMLLKNSKLELVIKNHLAKATIIAIISHIALLLIGMQTGYVLAFFIGYFLINNAVETKTIVVMFFVCVLLGIIRIVSHKSIDGSLLYDQIIMLYFNIIASTFITLLIKWLYNKVPKIFSLIYNLRITKLLEKNSYYIYIVHFSLIKSDYVFYIGKWKNQLIMFLLLTTISTYILSFMYNCIVKTILQENKNEQ